jgi:hypothetical protein
MTTTAERRPDVRRAVPLAGLVWVTWRQHRAVLAGACALLGGFAILLVVHGLAMHGDYKQLDVAACLKSPDCNTPYRIFVDRYTTWTHYLPAGLALLPAALGIFVGAPMVARELESGTFRFAWTQGASRIRWVGVKLIVLGAALVLLALGFSWLFSWWYGPWHRLSGRMAQGGAYEIEGVVFAARTLFGFAAGAFLGAAIRRTVPAMAATGVLWFGVVGTTLFWLRGLIAGPRVVSDTVYAHVSGTWTISSWVQDAAGHHRSQQQVSALARTDGVSGDSALTRWMAEHHYSVWDSYQPGSRFWHFQLVEGSGYVLLAVLLMAGTLWLVHRRAV